MLIRVNNIFRSKKGAIDLLGDIVIGIIIICVGLVILSVLMFSSSFFDATITSAGKIAYAIEHSGDLPFPNNCLVVEDVASAPKDFIAIAPQDRVIYILNDTEAYRISGKNLYIKDQSAIVNRISFQYPSVAARIPPPPAPPVTIHPRIKPTGVCCPANQNDKGGKCETTCGAPLVIGGNKKFVSDFCVCTPLWLDPFKENNINIEIYPKDWEGCI